MKAFMIIRDDGLWIEQRRDKGATHYEPNNKLPPRLWFNRANAQSWLTVYCKGKQTVDYARSYGWDGEPDDYPVTTLQPVEGRVASRFTILEINIRELDYELVSA